MKTTLYITTIVLSAWYSAAFAQTSACFSTNAFYSASKGGIFADSVKSLSPFPSSFSADFNHDGSEDLVLPYQEQSSGVLSLLILLSDSSQNVVDTLHYPLGQLDNISYVMISDFNGDDKFDLAVMAESWGFFGDDRTFLFILLGNCEGGFTDPVSYFLGYDYPGPLSKHDFNGDGKDDLATTTNSGGKIILFGNGDGSFWLPRSSASSAIGDFNGDGKLDLAAAYYSSPNQLSVFNGNGEGGFNGVQTLAVGSKPEFVVAADLNKDGHLDLVTANRESNNVSVLLSNGIGGFGAATNFEVGLQPRAVALGDFNKDGMVDLATANIDGNNISVLLGNGAGSFATSISYAVGGKPIALVAADFNNDGGLDLAVANSNDRNVSVLLNNKAGGFGDAIPFFSGWGSPSSIVCADFNNNGTLDLAVGNAGGWDESSDFFSILDGDGTGGFEVSLFREGEYSSTNVGLTSADFNGDGLMDVAMANHSTSVFFNTGAGNFGQRITYNTNGNAISSADFNNDSKPDLVTTGSDLTVLLNYNPVITAAGPTTFCAGGSVTLKASATGDPYSWQPVGGVADSLVVTTSGTYRTFFINGCISNTITVIVNPLPLQPASFTDKQENVCHGQVNTSYAIPNDPAVTYSWDYSGVGATLFADGNSVLINFDESATSGFLSVVANNNCGVSLPRTINIRVSSPPQQPGAFTDSLSVVCQGQGNVSYVVPNDPDVTYDWSFSGTGAIIQGDSNSVLFSYDNNATSGNVSVVGFNACGTSAATTMSVTVHSTPAAPTISSNGLNTAVPLLASSYTDGNQWFLNNEAIPGATNNTLAIDGPGVYAVMAAVNGCPSELSDTFTFVITGTQKPYESSEMSLFPNPARNDITINLSGFKSDMPLTIFIYDQLGRQIKVIDGMGDQVLTLFLGNYSNGNYLIRSIQGANIITKRFVKE